jgi:DivIVA domain-containing protein
MPLTPADVHSIVFKKAPVGNPGFDEDEVDAFLDEVEHELGHLYEENNALRTQLEGSGLPGSAPQTPRVDEPTVDELHHVMVQIDQARQDQAAAEQAVWVLQTKLEQIRPPTDPAYSIEQHSQPVTTMAKRTADQHVRDSRRTAEQILSEARRAAQAIIQDAYAQADALERDARQRAQQMTSGLEDRQNAMLAQIEQLTTFEREYRVRLKESLDSYLRDLDAADRRSRIPAIVAAC